MDKSDESLSVTVETVLLTVREESLWTLVLKREESPQRGRWALPGGTVRPTESLQRAAERTLEEQAGIRDLYLEQLYTFGDPQRYPRGRVIAVAYFALIAKTRFDELEEGSGEPARIVVPWEGETGGPVSVEIEGRSVPLGFDHDQIIGMAVRRIRGKLNYTPIGFQLLPREFTLRELQDVHETILDQPLNKDSFRRKMLATGYLEATGEKQSDVDHRPAELYRFARHSAI